MKNLLQSWRWGGLSFAALCILLVPRMGKAVDFEAPIFLPGPLPQGGWDELIGSGGSAIDTDSGRLGTQGLKVMAESLVMREFPDDAEQILYLDGWYHAPESSVYPDLNQIDTAGPIIVFHDVDGLVVLDGDGNGGGDWIRSKAYTTGEFTRITVELDFEEQTWNLYINRKLYVRELGFKNSAFTRLAALQVTTPSGGEGYLDNVLASSSPPDFMLPNHSQHWSLYE